MENTPSKKTRGGARQGAGRKPSTGMFKEKTTPVRVPLSKVEWVREQLLQLATNTNSFFSDAYFQDTPIGSFKLYQESVSAGTPFDIQGDEYTSFEFSNFLETDPQKDFLLKVAGDSMVDAGIYDGDLVLVKPTHKAVHGDLVIACVEECMTLKRYTKKSTNHGVIEILQAENPNVSDIIIKQHPDVKIIGLVIGMIRKF